MTDQLFITSLALRGSAGLWWQFRVCVLNSKRMFNENEIEDPFSLVKTELLLGNRLKLLP